MTKNKRKNGIDANERRKKESKYGKIKTGKRKTKFYGSHEGSAFQRTATNTTKKKKKKKKVVIKVA